MVYQVYLLLRNSASRRLVNLARKKLKLAGVRNPEAVLFRCMPDEIKYIGKCDREKLESWVWELASNSVRWQVIFQRFFRDDAPVVAEDKKDEN